MEKKREIDSPKAKEYNYSIKLSTEALYGKGR